MGMALCSTPSGVRGARRKGTESYLMLDYRISIHFLAFSICALAESQDTEFGKEMLL